MVSGFHSCVCVAGMCVFGEGSVVHACACTVSEERGRGKGHRDIRLWKSQV